MINYLIIIINIILFGLCIGFIFYQKNRFNKEKKEIESKNKQDEIEIIKEQYIKARKEIEEQEYNSIKEEQENKIRQELLETHNKTQQLKRNYEIKQVQLQNIENQINDKLKLNENLKKLKDEELQLFIEEKKQLEIEKLNEFIKNKKSHDTLQIQKDIEEWTKSAQIAANDFYYCNKKVYDNKLFDIVEQIKIETEKLNNLKLEIEDYQQKRNIINEQISQDRKVKEQQDFYSINISNDDKNDIEIINSILPKIKKIEQINKLIYDNYISRNLKDMIKRVLNNKEISGIYKVINKETNEIYIGKSTDLGHRWTGHVKSACGLDGVADSQFQRALKKYGIDSFTWELLEEVPKEKLTEREKYWIEFYDTKTYGYNQRKG